MADLIDLGGTRAEPRTDVVWSPFQQAFFYAISDPKGGNILLEAVAGSGKTTTLVEAANLVPTGDHSLFLAFNRSVADELGTKLPYSMDSYTFHSLGLRALKTSGYNPKINKNKSYNILRKELLGQSDIDQEFYDEYAKEMVRFVSQMKGARLDALDKMQFRERYEGSGLLLPPSSFGMHLTYKLYLESLRFDGEKDNEIDFDDMLRLPMVLDDVCYVGSYDWVFVDEVQDLNYIQREIVAELAGESGRVVAVGDPVQAIYAFRGADHNSIVQMQERFGMTKLPLSVTYRCPTSVVKRALVFQPEIQAREGAQAGEVFDNYPLDRMIGEADSESHILCRTVAPLVKVALRLGLRGTPVSILGKDVTWRVINVAKQIDMQMGKLSHEGVNAYCAAKLEELGDKEQRKGTVVEVCEIIGHCIGTEFSLTIAQLKETLLTIFSDKPDPMAITLSTIHKAKGLEADKIYIIRPDLLPHPLAKDPEARQQEDNLHYVAITRAKKELYYVV